MQQMSYYCDCCGDHINTLEHPVVVYIVAGVVGDDQELPADAFHPFVPAMMARRIPRLELSGECVGPVMSVLFGTDEAAKATMLERIRTHQALRAELPAQ